MEVPLPPGAEHVNLPPLPPDEDERMEVLQALELLKDYSKHPGITAICSLLKDCLSMSVAGVSVVGKDCILFRATPDGDVAIFPRNIAVGCTWLLVPERPELLVIEDLSRDPRTRDNPYVKGPEPCWRFYAGAPLISSMGAVLGTLCVLDTKPRQIGEAECHILLNTAECVVRELEQARYTIMERKASTALLRTLDLVSTPLLLLDVASVEPPARILYCNKNWSFDTGDDEQQIVGKGFWSVHKPAALPLEQTLTNFLKLCQSGRDFKLDIALPRSLFARQATVVFWPANKAMAGACVPALTYQASGLSSRQHVATSCNLYFAIVEELQTSQLDKPTRSKSGVCGPAHNAAVAELPDQATPPSRAVSSPPGMVGAPPPTAREPPSDAGPARYPQQLPDLATAAEPRATEGPGRPMSPKQATPRGPLPRTVSLGPQMVTREGEDSLREGVSAGGAQVPPQATAAAGASLPKQARRAEGTRETDEAPAEAGASLPNQARVADGSRETATASAGPRASVPGSVPTEARASAFDGAAEASPEPQRPVRTREGEDSGGPPFGTVGVPQRAATSPELDAAVGSSGCDVEGLGRASSTPASSSRLARSGNDGKPGRATPSGVMGTVLRGAAGRQRPPDAPSLDEGGPRARSGSLATSPRSGERDRNGAMASNASRAGFRNGEYSPKASVAASPPTKSGSLYRRVQRVLKEKLTQQKLRGGPE